MVANNKVLVKQLTSKTDRLYANTTIKSMRNRVLRIFWKPQLSALWKAFWKHTEVNLLALKDWKCERQAAAVPSDKFRQMLGLVPLTVYTECVARWNMDFVNNAQ